MKNILEDLYNGNISPWEKAVIMGSEYHKAMAAFSTAENKLQNLLEGESKILLDKLLNAHSELINLSSREYFYEGVKLGVKLMAAVYENDSKNFKDILK